MVEFGLRLGKKNISVPNFKHSFNAFALYVCVYRTAKDTIMIANSIINSEWLTPNEIHVMVDELMSRLS